MEFLTDTREIIIELKKVYKAQNLSYKKVYKMSNDKYGEGFISESTIQRIFKEGSEENPASFRYETTLIPLCNLLLDKSEGTTSDLLLRFKKDLIEEYAKQNQELKEEIKTIKEHEKVKYAEKLAKETKHFNDSLAFLSHQIELKDQRIDALLATTTELMATNNQLLKQLMDCPLKKEDCK